MRNVAELEARIRELEAAHGAATEDLRFLDAMERLGRALRRSTDLSSMLEACLDELLDIFGCDRAWLLHPCAPEAPSWGVPMERTRAGWPGVFALGAEIPMDEGAAEVFAEALQADVALPFDSTTERSPPEEISRAFGVRAQMVIAIRPHRGAAWLLGLHHCAADTIYTELDQRIFKGLAHRLADALDSMLLRRELQDTEQQVAQLQRAEAIGSLAAGVSHDFNNKLLVILCYAELLREELPGGHPYIDQVVGAADKAADLTRELLAFSRRAVLEPRPVDLTDAAHASVGLLSKAMGSAVRLAVPVNAPSVIGVVDPAQLEQVLVNLVINARDALPQGGTITIRTEAVDVDGSDPASPPELQAGRYATLAVIDDGVGMDEATRRRVFDPFFTTKERGKGTGLGLSTAYGVARQSGGTLTVSSAPEEGSSFTVWLPATDDAPAMSSGSYPPVRSVGGQERILLVDGDREVAEVTARVLRTRGYEVTWAEHGEAALPLLGPDEADFDLLLTEVMMAGLDGVALGERALALQPDVKVTFTTGYSGDAFERLLTSGASRKLLQKPYTPEKLLAHVRAILDSQRR